MCMWLTCSDGLIAFICELITVTLEHVWVRWLTSLSSTSKDSNALVTYKNIIYTQVENKINVLNALNNGTNQKVWPKYILGLLSQC